METARRREKEELRLPDIFRQFSCLERSQGEEEGEEKPVSQGGLIRKGVRGLRGNCTHKSKLFLVLVHSN